MVHKTSQITIDHKHIDEYGHANYKAIPAILEPVQDGYLASAEVSFKQILEEHGLRSVVVRMDITYKGELLENVNGAKAEYTVDTYLSLGRTSLKLNQYISLNGERKTEMLLVVVLINAQGESTSIPEALLKKLA